mgnify:CR=1 FL=1
MLLKDYTPHSMLNVKTSRITHPRFPVIDAHNHLAEPFGGGWDKRSVCELLDVLDESHVRIFVDLDGGWSEDLLNDHLEKYKSSAPERFCIFGGVDWSKWSEWGDRFGEWAGKQLRRQVQRGAQGLKIWKALGLHVRDHRGALVAVNDIRLDPLWQTAADLRIPVVIHIADPVAFFSPLDGHNERWEELSEHPDWHFASSVYPRFDSIMEQFAELIKRNSQTTFIGAHVGCYAENLEWVGNLLDECPNFFVDIAARIAELGRQPYTARRFFLNYADRIVFGTDFPADVERYRIHYRFLESDDEYFNYDLKNPPTQGRWQIYGLYLPDDVLEKVYYANAIRLLNLST